MAKIVRREIKSPRQAASVAMKSKAFDQRYGAKGARGSQKIKYEKGTRTVYKGAANQSFAKYGNSTRADAAGRKAERDNPRSRNSDG